MQFKYSEAGIELEKELNSLDSFVIDFTKILNEHKIKYVVISGYVSILFGRNRSSEDIDLILEKLSFEKFHKLWKSLEKEFDCIITSNAKEAYDDYLNQSHAIRFAIKNEFIPNMEIKFLKTELDLWTLHNRKKVLLNKNKLFISPMELQIPFKLFLGSEKDIEDAKYLYNIFKGNLDAGLLHEFKRKLNIVQMFNKYLK